jgi:hypothetical protein
MVKETKEILAELKVEVFFNKLMVQLSEMIFMNFSLLLVTFILLINVFSTNVISLGFLFFAMYLIYLNLSFYKEMESQAKQRWVLQFLLLPYLLLDILIQLLVTIPLEITP